MVVSDEEEPTGEFTCPYGTNPRMLTTPPSPEMTAGTPCWLPSIAPSDMVCVLVGPSIVGPYSAKQFRANAPNECKNARENT